jgi:hypothetical protein
MTFSCAYQYCCLPVPDDMLLCETHTHNRVALYALRERLTKTTFAPEDAHALEVALSEYGCLTAQVREMWFVISARCPDALTRDQGRKIISELWEIYHEVLPEMYQEHPSSANPYFEKITSVPVPQKTPRYDQLTPGE